jgi:hypothetical protein
MEVHAARDAALGLEADDVGQRKIAAAQPICSPSASIAGISGTDGWPPSAPDTSS